MKEKLAAASDTRASIDEKRENFRSVAARGSVLYFAIVEMSTANVMYQSSLDQFVAIFIAAIDAAGAHGFCMIENTNTNILVTQVNPATLFDFVRVLVFRSYRVPSVADLSSRDAERSPIASTRAASIVATLSTMVRSRVQRWRVNIHAEAALWCAVCVLLVFDFICGSHSI